MNIRNVHERYIFLSSCIEKTLFGAGFMETGHIIQHRYQIVQVLGHGGMGTTYKAIDLQTEDPVAVKRLHFFQMKAWKALEMFEREAKILQQLNHPRIPKYLDYFSVETSEDVEFVLVQEYIEGQTLQQLVEDGWKRTESEILDLFLQLVNILDYLHALFPPVIHRDINPKNIILSPNNEVYLVDFGAVQEKIRTTFLGGSTIVGTYGYVPFEQFTGKAVPASDYYALGATLLYMLTHKHPADFPTERLRLVFHDSVQASPTMIHLLEELLEPSVKRRLASSEQVRELLTEQSTESQEQLVNVSKPITLKIKKVTRASDCILFRMPNRTNIVAAVLFGSFGAWLLTAFLISLFTNAWDSLPFSLLICLPACGGTLYSLCKRAVLELTPEWVWLSRKSFGIGSSQCVLTAELRRKDVTWYLENGLPGISGEINLYWRYVTMEEHISSAIGLLLPRQSGYTRKSLSTFRHHLRPKHLLYSRQNSLSHLKQKLRKLLKEIVMFAFVSQ